MKDLSNRVLNARESTQATQLASLEENLRITHAERLLDSASLPTQTDDDDSAKEIKQFDDLVKSIKEKLEPSQGSKDKTNNPQTLSDLVTKD